MLGKRSKQLGFLERTISTWMWAAAPSTASWPPCGDSYFETKTSPNCIARTMAGIACRPVWWPPRCCYRPTTKYERPLAAERTRYPDKAVGQLDRPFAKSTLQLFRAQLVRLCAASNSPGRPAAGRWTLPTFWAGERYLLADGTGGQGTWMGPGPRSGP